MAMLREWVMRLVQMDRRGPRKGVRRGCSRNARTIAPARTRLAPMQISCGRESILGDFVQRPPLAVHFQEDAVVAVEARPGRRVRPPLAHRLSHAGAGAG